MKPRVSEYAGAAIAAILLVIIAAGLMGCGDTEDPLEPMANLTNAETGILAAEKHSGLVPAAPSAPTVVPEGTPFVKEVGFYHDWQLTKPITAPVAVGSTIFIKVVFSEPMKHVVSDGKEARPILYYQHRTEQGATLARFKMADQGAKGEDFLPGDAKPLHSGTDGYICKYTVDPEDGGKQISLMVGRFSVDLEGNPLAAFYRHKVKIRVQKPVPVVEEMAEPEPAIKINRLDPAIVEKYLREDPTTPVPYWRDESVVSAEMLPPSAWVLNFPDPFKHHAPPRSRHNDFVGQVVMPVSGIAALADWSDGMAPVPNVIVTITNGTRAGEQVLTNSGGYYRFRDIEESEIYLRVERAYLEPKEVIVYRSRPTELQHIGANRVFAGHHTQEPGAIVMGLRWPDAMRFILEKETLPHDMVYIFRLRQSNEISAATGGMYQNTMVVTEIYPAHARGRVSYPVISHELAHARQHAIALQHGGTTMYHWVNTPEGKEYKEAMKKDLKESGNLPVLDDSAYKYDVLENAAEFCAIYWKVGIGLYTYVNLDIPLDLVQDLRTRAPNRFKWAQAYLNKRY